MTKSTFFVSNCKFFIIFLFVLKKVCIFTDDSQCHECSGNRQMCLLTLTIRMTIHAEPRRMNSVMEESDKAGIEVGKEDHT